MPRVIDILDQIPDGFLRAALIGLPRLWEVNIQPDTLKYQDAEVIYVARGKEAFIPRHSILMTDRQTAPSIESHYDVKRVFVLMSDMEKRKALGSE